MKKNIKFLLLIAVIIIACFGCKKDDPVPITVTDIDGNVYHTVTIGTQVWMVENLKVSHYKNGTAIQNVTDDATWLSLTTGAYCDYNNTPSNSSTYGKLYNWHAVNTGNLCPTGWHVPSDAEWTTLTNFLGGENIAGGKLKATTLWSSPNTGATNISVFTALPGGTRNGGNGTYYDVGNYGYWWSSTKNNTTNAWYRRMDYNSSDAFRGLNDQPTAGFSVRCLKD